MSFVVPAVLPSSRKDLEEKIALFSRIPSVDRIQIDVVDGRLVSPACWPYTNLEEFHEMVEHASSLPLIDRIEYEVDLMCEDADQAARDWIALGASRFTVHAESITELPHLIALLRQQVSNTSHTRPISLGVAINISTDLSEIESILGNVQYVQFMGIEKIGQQGQPFASSVLTKIHAFREKHPEVVVQVDGGVTPESAKELVELGVTNLVVGSAILHAIDPVTAVAEIEALRSSSAV